MKFLIIASVANSLVGFRKPFIIALLDKGLEVHVAAPELLENQTITSELKALGAIPHSISMQRTGLNPAADTKTLFSIYSLMRNIKPDYMMGYTIKPVIYGTLAAWLARVPKRFSLITGLGFAFTGGEDNKRKRVRAVAQGLYRTALRHCQIVFFQNHDDEALFYELNIISSQTHTCVVSGSGVDVDEFDVVPFDTQKPLRFLLIARLLGDKGVREYNQAAQQVKKLHPEVQFDLVGGLDANPTSITQAELDKWIESGTINFLGLLKDVRPAIQASSVYVLPSYREGTPRTVLEAMAMGRAVITTDAPGCRETVVDGDNGFLVPVKDADALAQAMLRFIEEPELIGKMGKRSRAIAEEKYDVHKVNAQMMSAMELE
ncbi:glycosyltransferase family 4 protein [Psychrobacter sp. P2G3]|uniref:glycosyltransferase family 4 protein n=1 Tax=Psychrobacter sp. P2G3 TaxID=1699622 RepID=UPI00078B403C|nr:glycosyltransferase family 4 protein [Psychrobacter sp. P2G3]AMN49099.1 glycosyl transferase [Psychrobacter sp. P2G3]